MRSVFMRDIQGPLQGGSASDMFHFNLYPTRVYLNFSRLFMRSVEYYLNRKRRQHERIGILQRKTGVMQYILKMH